MHKPRFSAASVLLGIVLAIVMTGVNATLAGVLHHGPFSPWFNLGGFYTFR